MMAAVKLNLGCGDVKLAGYHNIDIKNGVRVWPLAWPDESVDEIRASHILEHFGHREVGAVLDNWAAKLKPGGTLKIAVPDFGKLAKAYSNGEAPRGFEAFIMGGHVDEHDRHGSIWDRQSLTAALAARGFANIEQWSDDAADCSAWPISLNLQGTKAGVTPVTCKSTKISAVMSMPRLTFTDNMFSAVRSLTPLGIDLDRGQGVFWGQVLTRMIESHKADGSEFIITIDYDTWFRREHVQRLCQLIVEHPEADAIVPLQVKREHEHPLLGMRDAQGGERLTVAVQEFAAPLTPIYTGHFGLTIFRAAAFDKLQKPWFLGQPGADGGWGDDRTDEDIYFWRNFAASGLKAYLANEVNIGHAQLMCTLPGRPEDNWRPIHAYFSDIEAGKIPSHCVPKVETLREGGDV